MAVAVGAATAGGFLLRHAADLERQTLRTQQLAGAAFKLQDFSLQAEAEKGVSKRLAVERKRAPAASTAAFRLVRAHDRQEGDRIRAAFLAYLRGSTAAFERAAADRGRVPAAEQRQVERQLGRLESQITAEIERQARATRVTNPEARAALVVAALAVTLLVGVLIWQFEMQRRAGRIDRDYAERSAELVRVKDEFVAAVSHELRTPLTSILGYLDLIGDSASGTLAPDQEAFLVVIRRNADRLLRLVSDLLLVAQVEGGTLALEIEQVDLARLAAACVEAAKPAAAAKQLRLTLGHGSSGRLEGDPIRLAQMIDNLISNAIKFTPAGGQITVNTADQDGQVLFEVADSGSGISAADQARLFDRFFRTRAAAAQAIQGTGLGLTITKAIVDAHHGSISIESALGAGTTFHVVLPQTLAATVPPPTPGHSTTRS